MVEFLLFAVVQSYVFIDVRLPSQPARTQSVAVAQIDRERQLFLSDKVSGGQYDIQGTWAGDYPILEAADCPYSNYIQKAANAASASGFTFNAGQKLAVLSQCGDLLTTGNVSIQGLTLQGFYLAVPKNDNLIAWGIGRLLGLPNAGSEYCSSSKCYTTIGDSATFMGEGSGSSLTAQERRYAGFLSPSLIQTTITPGTYRIRLLDLPPDGSYQALLIGNYYVDVRKLSSTSPPDVRVHANFIAKDLLPLTDCNQRVIPVGQQYKFPGLTVAARTDSIVDGTNGYADITIVGGSPLSTITCTAQGKDGGVITPPPCTKNCGPTPTPTPTPTNSLPDPYKFALRISNGDTVADILDNHDGESNPSGAHYFWNLNPVLSQNATVGGVYEALNYEHIFNKNGSSAHPFLQPENPQWPWFTPRFGPMRQVRLSSSSVQMTRLALDEPWRVETKLTYTAYSGGIDLHIEHTITDVSLFEGGYAGFFYATYASQQQVLGLNFMTPGGGIASFDPNTMSCGNYRAFGEPEIIKGDATGGTPVYVSDPNIQYAEPWYFSLAVNNMVFGYMFKDLPSDTQIRFTECKYAVKPPVLTPALDWQFIINHPEQGKTYSYNVRVPWKRFVNAESFHQDYHTWTGIAH